MKKINGVALALTCAFCAQQAMAEQEPDSVSVHQLNEVVVKAVRVQKDAPFAVSNINKQELQDFATSGKELPFLFARTPGILAWSENGTGIGTTYMRMRGAAGSRINVTLDGVSLNSPEDQTVFWANMNSYASLLGSVQIQRGVGSSTNGDGAFGGSISLATAAPQTKPFLEVTGSYGSFATYHAGASFSTGLLFNRLVFDGAYHESKTDGFIHGTSGRSGSYYGGLTWLGDNFQIRYKNIGNFEKTGQAWNGVIGSDYDTTESLFDYGYTSYKDLWKAGLGKVNTLVENLNYDADAWSKGNFSTTRYQLSDGSNWDRTTDNFNQNHNILSATWQPSLHWTHNVALHYTYGDGYYKEFKNNSKFAKFGLVYYDAEGNKVKKSDFIRKKGLTQNTYGMAYNFNYKNDQLDLVGGVNLQQFDASHWGYLTYIKDTRAEQMFLGDAGKYHYYDSDARKGDYSAFVKGTYSFADNWNAFLDLQYRYVRFKTDGVNDKFIEQEDGTYKNQVLDVNKKFHFFNPKVGMTYTDGAHKAYWSAAISHREPERNNYTDNGNNPFPKKETVYDVELGYQYTGDDWFAGANLYYMNYDNQLVQTGELSDIGEALTTNVKKSYRMGVELTAGWAPLSWLSLEGNAALSQNKIKDFDEYVESWDAADDYLVKNHYSNSTLSYSPNAILNGFVDFHYKGFSATWHTNFVSKQYVDNSESDARSLPCYSQSNASLNWRINLKNAGVKSVKLGVDFNNVFDRHYAASGYTWYGWYTGGKRYQAMAYIPMAGFHVMGHLTLRF